MAAQLSLKLRAQGALEARSLRSFRTTALSRKLLALRGRSGGTERQGQKRRLPVPNPTSVFCVSRTSALRNPTRHEVTTMAPQDFPLCAAFQEE